MIEQQTASQNVWLQTDNDDRDALWTAAKRCRLFNGLAYIKGVDALASDRD